MCQKLWLTLLLNILRYLGRRARRTLDLRVAPHEPVHRGDGWCSLEGHVKRHRRVVVFSSARPRAASSSKAQHIICVRKGVGRENDHDRATSAPSSSRVTEKRRVDGVYFTTSSVCHKLGASAGASRVFATIVSLSTADRLPARATWSGTEPYSQGTSTSFVYWRTRTSV